MRRCRCEAVVGVVGLGSGGGVSGSVVRVSLEDVVAVELHQGDCLTVMRGMADNSVDAVVTDPPYFRVKGEEWDRQWDTASGFIAWIGELAAEWQRILRPNGSLYCFASPQMAARVEVEIGGRFNVINHIVWEKTTGRWNGSCKEDLRSYFPQTERIIFAEHFNSDNMAKGEAGYVAKCDELRGFVFEPLRAYLDGERQAAGVTPKQCNEALGNQMAGHYFTRTQWALPTEANYEKLRALFNKTGEYSHLRREYEDLRREYEDLRRPFAVTADVPYTDVWHFSPVQAYPGKHPCEKPGDLIRHIIEVSTREGATVLDCFMGSGVTGEQCELTGRNFIGIEKDDKWFAHATARIQHAQAQPKQEALFA